MRTGGARNGEGAWDVVIRPRRSLFDMDLKGVWQYRDLVRLLVRRDVIAVYKQTVLGPLWHIIQPLTTTITFTVIFGMVARLSPEGVPAVLFYMSGIVAWNYFSTVVTKTSKTFIGNTNLMSKVYFPRLVVPLSTALSSLVSFGIQFATMLAFFLWYHLFNDGFTWRPAPTILLLPLLVVVMALLGLGAGIIVSALTTKYRDLSFLVGFGVQLLMYASPVIFPLSLLQGRPTLELILRINPMTPVIEAVRTMLFGGALDWTGLAYATGSTVVVLFAGLLLFQRVERSFADIV
ncbi:MAG: ABC transporter permease [Flavobacteriales bacterium]|nr:ABC transporter permease [Flavobacteriales bacterium]MCB0807664.1 ABC transporter permease [Flavobacteriales bacterium]